MKTCLLNHRLSLTTSCHVAAVVDTQPEAACWARAQQAASAVSGHPPVRRCQCHSGAAPLRVYTQAGNASALQPE